MSPLFSNGLLVVDSQIYKDNAKVNINSPNIAVIPTIYCSFGTQ